MLRYPVVNESTGPSQDEDERHQRKRVIIEGEDVRYALVQNK